MVGVNRLKQILPKAVILGLVLTLAGCGSSLPRGISEDGTVTITNVSYDPTRELYEQYNAWFKEQYEKDTGTRVNVIQSHGGSGGQARSVVEGADADVVTLALEHDVSMVEHGGLIDEGWIDEFSLSSSPYTSTIVFLVREGNPRDIRDWKDLINEDVDIINPDPKSSGGACWNFLAAWGYADELYDGDIESVIEFMTKLYANVTVMDSGARGATTTFVENGQGDVLIAWENEAIATVREYPGKYEIISPSLSILAQPSVAVVDANARRDGVEEQAADYLSYLYKDEAQRIIGVNGYRPSNKDILSEYADTFDLSMKLITIEDFGGWDAAYETYFEDGALFDEIYGD